MNQTESPLVPQGSLLEQKNKGRARVKIAVFVVLAVHGIGLMALLMQGCKPNSPQTAQDEIPTNSVAMTEPAANPPAVEDTNLASQFPSNPPTLSPEPVNTNPPVQLTPVPTPAPTGTEYTILKGDTFGKLAKDFHVSVSALLAANPGVDPARLKIGQTVHIPAPDATATSPGTTLTPSAPASSPQTYTVKSGDTLTRIASQHKTTVKALRAANSLKTDAIKVGQRLKIPTKNGNGGLTADQQGASSLGTPGQ